MLLKRGDNGSMGDVACIAYDQLVYYRSFDRAAVAKLIECEPMSRVLEADWGYEISPIIVSQQPIARADSNCEESSNVYDREITHVSNNSELSCPSCSSSLNASQSESLMVYHGVLSDTNNGIPTEQHQSPDNACNTHNPQHLHDLHSTHDPHDEHELHSMHELCTAHNPHTSQSLQNSHVLFTADRRDPIELLVGWTRLPSISSDMIKQVRSRIDEQFISQSQAIVDELRTALLLGDADGIQRLIRRAGTLLQDLHPAIYHPSLVKLCEAAQGLKIAAKSSGSGGGDCGIAISCSKSDSDELLRRWKTEGIEPLIRKDLMTR